MGRIGLADLEEIRQQIDPIKPVVSINFISLTCVTGCDGKVQMPNQSTVT